MNEWVFRSLLRWGRSIGIEALAELMTKQALSHVQGGGRVLTATAHGGKSATFTLPADLRLADLWALLERVLWFLENFSEEDLDNYFATYPSSVARARFDTWTP